MTRRLPHLVLTFSVLVAACVWAQQHPPQSEQPEAQKDQQGRQSEPAPFRKKPAEHGREAPNLREQLAEASREAAHVEGEEEGHAKFKQSSSVRWLAHATGLNPEAAYWVFVVVNFAIVAGAIAWIWRLKAPHAFRARTAAIREGMEEARRATEEANRRLTDIETRLSRLDSEIAGLRASADAEAAAEAERMRAAVEEDRRKIVEAAQQEIEAASRQAQRDLKAYAAELAVSLAEKRIQIDSATDRALLGTFVRQLADSNGLESERSS